MDAAVGARDPFVSNDAPSVLTGSPCDGPEVL